MIRIRLSKEAADYFRRETEYLRHRSPAAATSFVSAIKEARQLLQRFPEAGNRMHGLQISGSLTLVVGDYLLDYMHDAKGIDIIAIRHGRMLPPMPDADIDGGLADE